jgi:hypothetical protein
MSNKVPTSRLLSTTKAAAYLDIHPKTLAEARDTGFLMGHPAPLHIPMCRRKYFYDIRDLDAWIAARLKIRVTGSEPNPKQAPRKVAVKPARLAAV